MGFIETLRNLPGVEEVKTEIVLDRIKEDHSIIIPECMMSLLDVSKFIHLARLKIRYTLYTYYTIYTI